MSSDLLQSLQDVVESGADRILTSGGAQSALEGAGILRELVSASSERIIIMAAGGINDQNIEAVIKQTGVREIHVGLRTSVASPMLFVNESISMGTIKGQEYQRFVVTEDSVEAVNTSGRAHGGKLIFIGVGRTLLSAAFEVDIGVAFEVCCLS